MQLSVVYRSVVCLSLLVCASACQNLNGSLNRQELTWLSLHAVDVTQTLSASGDPCYKESAWLTERLIGEHPNEAEVVAWGVGTAIAHWWIGKTLKKNDAPKWLQNFWSYTTIAHTGYTVLNNHGNGVRPFSENQSVSGCGV